MRVGGGGGDLVSAVPDALMAYANVATPNDQSLQGYARTASDAIQSFLRSNPDPSVMPGIPDVGAETVAYAAQKGAIDQWVFDVGLAFLSVAEQNLPPGAAGTYSFLFDLGQNKVTVDDSQLQSALTNNALTAEATRDAEALNRLLASPQNPLQEKAEFDQLVRAIQFYNNDPIQLAAFFQKLGPKNTLFVAQYLNVMNPDALPGFSAALATATNSPTWNGHFDSSLASAVTSPGLGTQGQPLNPSDLALLLQSGVFSQAFLTNVGNVLIPVPSHIDALQAGVVVPAFFQALARNPQAALSYLTGSGRDEPGSRLSSLELMNYQYGLITGPAPGSWVSALAQATLAADGWAENRSAPPGAAMSLLKALAVPDWQDVPDSFRATVLQIVGRHLGSFLDTGRSGQLTQAEEQSLLALAVTDNSGSVNRGSVVALQKAIAGYVRTGLPLPDPKDQPAVHQWLEEVAKLAALPLLGQRVGIDSNEQAKAQAAVFLQLLAALGGAFQPEVEPEALGLSAAGAKALNGLLDFGEDKAITEPLEKRLLDTFYGTDMPAAFKNPGVTQQQAESELTVASLLYAKNPAWLPGSPDPTAARQQIAALVRIATLDQSQTTKVTQLEKDFQQAHPKYSLNEVDLIVTQLQAVAGNTQANSTPGS